MKPILNPAAERLVAASAHELPQSLLLHGETGVGLLTIASWLAGSGKAGELYPQNAKGERDGTGGTISVEMVRKLYETTRAKHTRQQVILVDGADHMSHGAQNAFLKLLEEPNETTRFILTAHRPQSLLPTVRSRVQAVYIAPATAGQTAAFLDGLGITDQTRRTQLQFIAPGLPAELTRLVRDETYFEQRASIVGDARDFLQGDSYRKILIIQKYKADRAAALRLVRSCTAILRRAVSAKPQAALIAQLDSLLDAEGRLAANQNIALQLARCVL